MEQQLFNFLQAQEDSIDYMSEGAYLNFLGDSVELFNRKNKTKHDPYETMMEYIRLTSTTE